MEIYKRVVEIDIFQLERKLKKIGIELKGIGGRGHRGLVFEGSLSVSDWLEWQKKLGLEVECREKRGKMQIDQKKGVGREKDVKKNKFKWSINSCGHLHGHLYDQSSHNRNSLKSSNLNYSNLTQSEIIESIKLRQKNGKIKREKIKVAIKYSLPPVVEKEWQFLTYLANTTTKGIPGLGKEYQITLLNFSNSDLFISYPSISNPTPNSVVNSIVNLLSNSADFANFFTSLLPFLTSPSPFSVFPFSVAPIPFFKGKDFIVMEFLEGKSLFQLQNSPIYYSVVAESLITAYILDQLGVTHRELGRFKHIIKTDNGVRFIDFERGVFSSRPRNFLQIVGFYLYHTPFITPTQIEEVVTLYKRDRLAGLKLGMELLIYKKSLV